MSSVQSNASAVNGGRSSREAEYIVERLNKLKVNEDVVEGRAIMRRILAMSQTDGLSSQRIAPSVIKLLSSTDMITKKLSAWFVSRHQRQHPELFLLAINTLVRDTTDPSPMVRALALKTITSVDERFAGEYGLPVTVKGLKDASPVVRRAAVLACGRLFLSDRDLILEGGIVDSLYAMIRDPDPIVLVNVLCTLEEILAGEGGIVINNSIAQYILDHLHTIPERNLPYVLNILTRYLPTDASRVADIMNALDPCLSSACPSVVLHTVAYFRQLAAAAMCARSGVEVVTGENAPDLDRDIIIRVKDHVLHFVGAPGDPETSLVLLDFIDSLLPQHVELFRSHYRLFFCRYSDPVYIRLKKLSLLGKVCDEKCMDEVVDELSMTTQDTCTLVARKSVSVLARLANRFPERAGSVVSVCSGLLVRHSSEDILADVLDALCAIDLTVLSEFPQILDAIEQCSFVVEGYSDAVKCSFISLLSFYGRYIDRAPYLLEQYFNELQEREGLPADATILECCLTAALSMFLHRPAECQDMLGAIMQACVESGDMDLKDKTELYYRWLKTDVNAVKNIFLMGPGEHGTTLKL